MAVFGYVVNLSWVVKVVKDHSRCDPELLAAVTFLEGNGDTFGEDVQQLSRALDGSGLRDDQDMHFEALATAVENVEILSF